MKLYTWQEKLINSIVDAHKTDNIKIAFISKRQCGKQIIITEINKRLNENQTSTSNTN